jgi:TolA-binding protein
MKRGKSDMFYCMKKLGCTFGYMVVCVVGSGCGVGLEGDVARLRSSLSDMRSLQAEQGAQLAQLQADVRGLQGKQEELEFVNTRHIGGEVASLKGEISSLKGRVPPPSGVPPRLLENDEQEAHALPSAVGSRLLEGFRLLRDGKFLDAVPVLKSSLDAAGDGDGAAVSLFWLGVAYDGVHDDRNALFAYNQVVTRFGSSPRAPSALLRQAQVFDRLGDVSTAQVTLEKLRKDFPSSPEARVAQGRLSRIGSGQR